MSDKKDYQTTKKYKLMLIVVQKPVIYYIDLTNEGLVHRMIRTMSKPLLWYHILLVVFSSLFYFLCSYYVIYINIAFRKIAHL